VVLVRKRRRRDAQDAELAALRAMFARIDSMPLPAFDPAAELAAINAIFDQEFFKGGTHG
jgi:hypothetical protein